MYDKDFETINNATSYICKQGHILYEYMLILEEQGIKFMITAAILWIRVMSHWGHPIVSSGKSYRTLPASLLLALKLGGSSENQRPHSLVFG